VIIEYVKGKCVTTVAKRMGGRHCEKSAITSLQVNLYLKKDSDYFKVCIIKPRGNTEEAFKRVVNNK
jgi:hypothetical protein